MTFLDGFCLIAHEGEAEVVPDAPSVGCTGIERADAYTELAVPYHTCEGVLIEFCREGLRGGLHGVGHFCAIVQGVGIVFLVEAAGLSLAIDIDHVHMTRIGIEFGEHLG